MAHSNRKKLRDARGGLTKHQAAKAAKKAKYRFSFDPVARMAELKKWSDEMAEKRANGGKETTVVVKRRRFSMTKPAQMRRLRVVQRLEANLAKGTKMTMLAHDTELTEYYLDNEDKAQINNLIKVLRSRIRIAA